MFEIFVSGRYLRTRLIVVISMVAVACAVVIAYVPNPVMEGFISQLKDKVRGTASDVVIETKAPADLEKIGAAALSIDSRALRFSPRIEGSAIFSTGDTVDPLEFGPVLGLDPQRETLVSDFAKFLEYAGTEVNDPFTLKPAAMVEIIRREKAEEALGREKMAAQPPDSLRAAFRRIGAELGARDYSDPSDFSRLLSSLARKYEVAGVDPAQAAEIAEEQALASAAENRARIEAEYARRAGRVAFLDLDAARRKNALAAAAIPPIFENSDEVASRLKDARRRPGVLVGTAMLDNWRDLRVGGEMELACASFAGPFDSRKSPKARNLIVVIVGTYETGLHDFDERTILMDFRAAASFFEDAGPVLQIGVKLADWREAESVRDALNEGLRDLDAQAYTWRQKREVLIDAVNRQRQVLFVILFFADIVAGFGIFVTLRILVAEKIQDIGIMAAIGATPARIMGAFLLTGLAIGMAGSLAGVAAGMGIVSLSNEIVEAMSFLGFNEFKSYIQEVQHLKRIPVEYGPATILKIVGATLASSILFSLYPAFLASRLKPVDAIRKEFL